MSWQDREPAASATVGRDAELAVLRELLDAVGSGRPAAAVLRGEPGSGKTHLLHALAREARTRGWVVLTAIGVEAETVLSGAALLSVLGPVRHHLVALPGVQASALSSALGWGEPHEVGADRFLVGAATLGLLAAVAVEAPVLVLVDDVQWIDDESADALAFASRRLGHDRVAIVVSQRSGAPRADRLAGLDVVDLAGLSPGAARELLGPGFATLVATRVAVSRRPS